MRVGDLMQRDVATLDLADHLDLADDVMRLGRIRHLPVVAGGHVVGILSQRDLFHAAASSLLALHYSTQQDWLGKIRVCDVMTVDVVTIGPEASLHDAVALMLERRIGCLPVVENETLVGLLGETDCLRHLARLLADAETRPCLPEFSG